MRKPVNVYYKIEAGSHAGLAGKQNEDRYAVRSFSVGRKTVPSVLAVLCDGIGGHRAGEVAAEIGVSVIAADILAGDSIRPLDTMRAAVTHANQQIYQASLSDKGRVGMGTTCACAWVIDDQLYTANLGDSRIYLLREGHLVQLTTDHTWIQEALDAGIIEDADGLNHPNVHVIRRYLGSEKTPEPDFRLWFFEGERDQDALANQGFKLRPGDLIMLCSDGLTDLVTDEEIRNVLGRLPLTDAPKALIEMANQRGGYDNVTVVLMSFDRKSQSGRKENRKRKWLVGCLIGLIVISAIAAAVVIGYRWWQGKLDDMEKPLPTLTQTMPASLPIPESTAVASPTAESSPNAQPSLSTLPPQATRTPWPTNTASDG